MNSEMITANGCNYIDDFLEHKNGFKYKDKYIGPNGKWVYVYTEGAKTESGTDIITGKTTEKHIPTTNYYYRNSDRLLSRTTVLPNLKGGHNSYHDVGKIERAVRSGGQKIGDTVEKGLNRGANTVSKGASRVSSGVYNAVNRASGGRLGAKVHKVKSDINEAKYAYSQAKKVYSWYKKKKKYIDAGSKFIKNRSK